MIIGGSNEIPHFLKIRTKVIGLVSYFSRKKQKINNKNI